MNFSHWDVSPGALECAWHCDTFSPLSPAGDLCLPPLPPAVHVDAPRIVAASHSVVELTVNATARSENAVLAPVLGYTIEFYDRRFNLTGSRSVPLAPLAPLAASRIIRLRVNGLWGSTPYTFRVAAFNIGGVGEWSNVSEAVATSRAIRPSALESGGAPSVSSATGSSLLATWTFPIDNGGAPITSSSLCIAKGVTGLGGRSCERIVVLAPPVGVLPRATSSSSMISGAAAVAYKALITGLAESTYYRCVVDVPHLVSRPSHSTTFVSRALQLTLVRPRTHARRASTVYNRFFL